MNMTYHAAIRSQQRGIPPLVMQWLDQFGEECYDGHGAIIRFFSQTSRREMEVSLAAIYQQIVSIL